MQARGACRLRGYTWGRLCKTLVSCGIVPTLWVMLCMIQVCCVNFAVGYCCHV